MKVKWEFRQKVLLIDELNCSWKINSIEINNVEHECMNNFSLIIDVASQTITKLNSFDTLSFGDSYYFEILFRLIII